MYFPPTHSHPCGTLGHLLSLSALIRVQHSTPRATVASSQQAGVRAQQEVGTGGSPRRPHSPGLAAFAPWHGPFVCSSPKCCRACRARAAFPGLGPRAAVSRRSPSLSPDLRPGASLVETRLSYLPSCNSTLGQRHFFSKPAMMSCRSLLLKHSVTSFL